MIEEFTSFGDITIEEGVVKGRNFLKPDLLETLEAADVNGPPGSKGQYIWDGSYIVLLNRGIRLSKVYSSELFGITGLETKKCIPKNESVTVIWMNRFNAQIPVILNGVTIDGYIKQLYSKGHLLDSGEYLIRSAISNKPEESSVSGKPFADNQFDQTSTAPNSKENIDKIVKNPGGEVFFDKFGRLSMLSRQNGHEFLVTVGKTDSGQDDVNLNTIADQDTYYDTIKDDESSPTDKMEPSKPKEINLSQYQQIIKDVKDSKGVPYKRGILPRFDKWIFKPIVVRKYAKDSDNELAYKEDVYAVYQERGELYVKTITSKGDLKEYLDGYVNQRIKGDYLLSIGGSLDIKVKSHDRDSQGNLTPNLAHLEMLSDGTIRTRVNENSEFKGTFDQTISPDGTCEIYIKQGGVSSTDYNVKIKLSPDGVINIESKKDLSITTTGKTDINATGECNVDGSMVNLGKNAAKLLCANIPNCLVTGAPVAVGNINVKC